MRKSLVLCYIYIYIYIKLISLYFFSTTRVSKKKVNICISLFQNFLCSNDQFFTQGNVFK